MLKIDDACTVYETSQGKVR